MEPSSALFGERRRNSMQPPKQPDFGYFYFVLKGVSFESKQKGGKKGDWNLRHGVQKW